jgi:hypothetical protein
VRAGQPGDHQGRRDPGGDHPVDDLRTVHP